MTRFWCALGHERFQPEELIRQATAAEQAGFDGVCCSDHAAPWWTEETASTSSGSAWVWLGAAARETSRVELGSAVTALVHRYNPLVVAQHAATLEALAPGRAFLGVGSGEAVNEVPAGMDWPEPEEQLARTEEALTIVTKLLDGEVVDFDGEFFGAKQARLYVQPGRRVPVILSAFHPGAAELAGRLADGIWTLGDPETAPELVDTYKKARADAGRDEGEIVIQGMFSWAETDEQALEGSREWKGTQVDEHYTDDVSHPARIYEAGEQQVSDEDWIEQGIVSADPEVHVEKIRELEQLGGTVVALMNVSGAAPEEALAVYGREVLPKLRD